MMENGEDVLVVSDDEMSDPKPKRQKGLGFFGFTGASAQVADGEARFACGCVSLLDLDLAIVPPLLF